MAKNEWDWETFFKSAAQAAFLIGVGYVGHRIQENEIDNLLNLSFEQAVRVVVESVPAMDNDKWKDFSNRLSNRAQYNNKANALLQVANLMVRAENEVRQILNRYPSPRQAAEVCEGVFRGKSQEEQFAFVAFLSYLSDSDYNAKAVLGFLVSS